MDEGRLFKTTGLHSLRDRGLIGGLQYGILTGAAFAALTMLLILIGLSGKWCCSVRRFPVASGLPTGIVRWRQSK